MQDEWMTVDEVAEYLKVSKTTVYRYADTGVIKKHKIGRFNRFRKSEVDEAVKNGKGDQ